MTEVQKPAGKSKKSQKRDKIKHAVHAGRPAKKGGGGGKGTWGQPGDELKYITEGGAVDKNDPNYDPQEVDESPPVPAAAGGSRTETPDSQEAPLVHKKIQEKFHASIKELAKFKTAVKTATEEFLGSEEIDEFITCVKELESPLFHTEIPVLLVKLSLDKSDEDRAKLSNLLATLCKRSLVSESQMTNAFRKLYNGLDDVLLDAPDAKLVFKAFVNHAVDNGYLLRSEVEGLEKTAEVVTDQKVVQAAKAKVKGLVEDYLKNPDLEELKSSLEELNSHLHYEVVKRMVSNALDHDNKAREAASVFLATFCGESIATDQVIKGFTILLQHVEDLALDVPDILGLLSAFVARAISDEALPPAFLSRTEISPGDMGFQVLAQAQALLNAPKAGLRLSKVWADEKKGQTPSKDKAGGDEGKAKPKKKGGKGKKKKEAKKKEEKKVEEKLPVDADCIFCKILAGAIPSYKVFETDRVVAFLDAFPVAKGHTLVLPKGHWETLDQLPEDHGKAIFEVLPKVCKAVKAIDGVGGYNVVQNNGKLSGQEVNHVHFHVIPRKDGDKVSFKFPPTTKIEKADAEAVQSFIQSKLK